jgi:hypothetical protein
MDWIYKSPGRHSAHLGTRPVYGCCRAVLPTGQTAPIGSPGLSNFDTAAGPGPGEAAVGRGKMDAAGGPGQDSSVLLLGNREPPGGQGLA